MRFATEGVPHSLDIDCAQVVAADVHPLNVGQECKRDETRGIHDVVLCKIHALAPMETEATTSNEMGSAPRSLCTHGT